MVFTLLLIGSDQATLMYHSDRLPNRGQSEVLGCSLRKGYLDQLLDVIITGTQIGIKRLDLQVKEEIKGMDFESGIWVDIRNREEVPQRRHNTTCTSAIKINLGLLKKFPGSCFASRLIYIHKATGQVKGVDSRIFSPN